MKSLQKLSYQVGAQYLWYKTILSQALSRTTGCYQVTIALLALAMVFLVPGTAQAAFDMENLKSKIISLGAFVLFMVVLFRVGMSFWEMNVAKVIVIVIVGLVAYGVLDPSAFKDVSKGVLSWFGVNTGSTQ